MIARQAAMLAPERSSILRLLDPGTEGRTTRSRRRAFEREGPRYLLLWKAAGVDEALASPAAGRGPRSRKRSGARSGLLLEQEVFGMALVTLAFIELIFGPRQGATADGGARCVSSWTDPSDEHPRPAGRRLGT